MTYRSYKIRLELTENTSIPSEMPTLFNALISDPSNLVPSGSTKQRGLSFLNKEGILLNNAAFKHVPIMDKFPYPITEEDEISNIIYQNVLNHFKLTNKDVIIYIART